LGRTADPLAVQSQFDGVCAPSGGASASEEHGELLTHIRDAHRSRATNLISLAPMVPACAAAVFGALHAEAPRSTPSTHQFLGRLMLAAVDKAADAHARAVDAAPGSEAERVYRREIWRNHHLVADMQRASPELRRIVAAVREVIAADGIVHRLGEPGFVEELANVCAAVFPRHAAVFDGGAPRGGAAPFLNIVADVRARMNEFVPEFSAESLSAHSPWVAVLRRAGYHEGCARIIESRRAA